jgi:hypothetical protein
MGAGATGEGVRDRGRGSPGRARDGAGPPGGARRGQGVCMEEERGGEGEEREGEVRGAHLGHPNSRDHRLQDLGHHGERERWERERGCCAGEIK